MDSLTVATIIVLCIILTVFSYLGIMSSAQDRKFEAECTSQGGIVVPQYRSSYLCFKDGLLIGVDK